MALFTSFIGRRSWEAWSVTIAPRHQAGGREVSWQEATSPGSTLTSSSSAAAPPVSDRMEAVWHKNHIIVAFSTFAPCFQLEMVQCGLVVGNIKGEVKS